MQFLCHLHAINTTFVVFHLADENVNLCDYAAHSSRQRKHQSKIESYLLYDLHEHHFITFQQALSIQNVSTLYAKTQVFRHTKSQSDIAIEYRKTFVDDFKATKHRFIMFLQALCPYYMSIITDRHT